MAKKNKEPTEAPLISTDSLQPQVPFSKETKLYCFDCRKLSIQKDMSKDKEDVYRCKKCHSLKRP